MVGDWLADIYEEAFYKGFKACGCDVHKFSWIQYFKYYQYPSRFDVEPNKLKSLYYRLQNRFTFGPILKRINDDLIDNVRENEYEMIFIYRGTHIYPKTLSKLKSSGCKVFGYNNDDPFSALYPRYFWRHFRNGIKEYDYIFSYREKNILDYKNIGFESSSILRSYYLNEKNFHIHHNVIKAKNINDVIFIGHFENDGRDEILLHLFENGVKLKLYGTDWEQSLFFNELVAFNGEIKPVYEDYNEVLNGAKVALVFLSKKNNDTYTRRCFEIPVTKTAMVSEYTDDLAGMFEENKEIIFFKEKEDCLDKVNSLISNPEQLKLISDQAYARLVRDGHEVSDRVKEILTVYSNELVDCS